MEAAHVQLIARTHWLLSAMECPLLRMDDPSAILSQEDPDIFPYTQTPEYQKIKAFVQPGSQRLNMLCWLVQSFDSTLLTESKSKTQAEQVEEALRMMGLLPWHLQIQNLKTVQGFNGFSASLQLLARTVELVAQDAMTGAGGVAEDLPPSAPAPSLKMLNEICQKSSKLFPDKARLYPPDFPATPSIQKAPSLSQLSEALTDWQRVKTEADKQLSDLLQVYYVQCQDIVKYDSLVGLKQSLLNLRDKATQLNYVLADLSSSSFSQKQGLQRGENNISHLAEAIKNCADQNSKANRGVQGLQSVIMSLNQLLNLHNFSHQLPSHRQISALTRQLAALQFLRQY